MNRSTHLPLRSHEGFRALIAILACTVFLVLCSPSAIQAAPPSGFVNEVYASGFDQPLQVIPAPDGRMFVVQKGGLIRVLPAGSPTPLTAPFLSITNLYTEHEAGILAMVLAPDFSTSKNYYWVTCHEIGHSVTRIA